MSDEVFGRVVWSEYFKSRIVVVRYENDEHWWFVVESGPRVVQKAQTPLSQMPTAPSSKKEGGS